MQILLFGGTTEGRDLASHLAAQGRPVTLCVATDYGAALAPDGPNITVHTGRLDGPAMEALMASAPFSCVVDATHPYAVEVSRNIRAAAEKAGLPCHRLVREGPPEDDGWLHAPSAAAAAQMLETLPGNVLLTTGSKDLGRYTAPGLRERIYPRVLPSLDSLSQCLDLGFPGAHVLCMQGPFTRAMNLALIGQYQIKTLVTKASGGAGGFWEKAAAAREAGVDLLVIDRPAPEEGRTYQEMLAFLLKPSPRGEGGICEANDG